MQEKKLNSTDEFVLKLTPLSRLAMAFDLELNLDKNGVVFDPTVEQFFINRQQEAEKRRDSVFKSLVTLDAALWFVVAGGGFTIPLIGVDTAQIPGLIPLLLLLSAFGIFIGATTFITWAAYETINSVISRRKCDPYFIDPELHSIAKIHSDIALKMFRVKLNIWGSDYYEPQTGFKAFSNVLNASFNSIFIVVISLHFIITYQGLESIFTSDLSWTATAMVGSFVVIANVVAAMVGVGAYSQFKFRVMTGNHEKLATSNTTNSES